MRSLVIFIVSLVVNTPLWAQVDPAIDWKVREEEHAVWIYDSRHKALIDQYSKNFRRIYPELKQIFREIPKKTTFVISDYTDMPNGSATVFPYPLVTIYPVIPLPNSPIGETDDSLYEILTHEYTHILNLHPVHGGMRALSWIFGSIVRPNTYLPRWYTEGLAVFTESYFMPRGGRLRSQNFEGMARAISDAKAWSKYPLDELNDFEPDWLGGRRAYLLGGALMYELATQHGLEEIYELNQTYSRRIPYFLNGPLQKRTGLKYWQLLDSTYNSIQERADAQIRLISSAPVTTGLPLQKQGNYNHRPSFSPDGQYLAYIYRQDDTPSAIQLLRRKPGLRLKDQKPERIAFGVEINELAWSPDSKKLAYNSVETFKRFYSYSDISVYDMATKETDRLTRGVRSGDLVFSPDGKSIYFVQHLPGSKQLAQLFLADRRVRVLYTPPEVGTNLYSLVAHEGQLLFIEQRLEKRTLKSLSLNTQKVQALNDNVATTRIRKTALGLLLTSSRSGVDNLYLVEDLKTSLDLQKSRVVTNSKTRILDGDIDPFDKTLYYAEQTNNGVFVFAQNEESWRPIITAPQVSPLMPLPSPPSVETLAEAPAPGPDKDFSPWPYMVPRYWMPFGYVIDGGMGFQASTGSSDPLGKNSYNVTLEWDTLTEKTGATFGYTNTSTPVELYVGASQVYRYSYADDSALKDTSYAAGGNFNVPYMLKNWNLDLSWRHSITEFSDSELKRSGPIAVLSFNNAIQRGYEISPMSGMTASIMQQAVLKDLGNIGYNKTNLTLKKYLSGWLPKRHVFFSQLNATYAPELKDYRLFTSNIGGNFFNNLLIPPFLVRGYPSGTLLGHNMLALNLEYRFPIANVYSGWDTVPFFIKQIHGAVIGDGVGLDGFRFSQQIQRFRKERFGDDFYFGYGAELNVEATLGYFLPVTFSFGIYRGGTSDLTPDDLTYFFNFRF